MTKKTPSDPQPWMPVNTDDPEDPNMYVGPPGDYDLRTAKEDPDIAEKYLQYIWEDLDRELSPKAKNYLKRCLREILDGKDANRAFNLVRGKGRPKSTVERDIDVLGRYYARMKHEKSIVLIRTIEEEYGISAHTFDKIRSQHKEFCKEHICLWADQKIIDSDMYDAAKIAIAKYIKQCNNPNKKKKP